jgi:phosphoenolpyruvate carboxykinase (GTP)
MLQRIESQASGNEHVFGITPRFEDLDWTGLAFSPDQFARITSIDPQAWRVELELHDQLFGQLSHGLPATLLGIRAELESRLDQRRAA